MKRHAWRSGFKVKGTAVEGKTEITYQNRNEINIGGTGKKD